MPAVYTNCPFLTFVSSPCFVQWQCGRPIGIDVTNTNTQLESNFSVHWNGYSTMLCSNGTNISKYKNIIRIHMESAFAFFFFIYRCFDIVAIRRLKKYTSFSITLKGFYGEHRKHRTHTHTRPFYNFARAVPIPRTAVSGFGLNKFVRWLDISVGLGAYARCSSFFFVSFVTVTGPHSLLQRRKCIRYLLFGVTFIHMIDEHTRTSSVTEFKWSNEYKIWKSVDSILNWIWLEINRWQ